MENTRYPVELTIKAFGGPSALGVALGLPKQNIHRWRTSVSGLIPRWWTVHVAMAAVARGIKLPKPKRKAA